MWKTCNRIVRDTFRALTGPRSSWGLQSDAKSLSRDLSERLRDAFERVSLETRLFDEQPVFLLSAGWRSGSTLLQRMIMENNEDLLIWGEPFAHSNIHDGLVNQFRAFTSDWPPEAYFLTRMEIKNPSDSWVANLYPELDYLVNAHRNFYHTLFAQSAMEAGRKNWGFKEVRLTIDHAMYLRILYPRCKIVFLYRNPLEAYVSYRKWSAGAFHTWPSRLVVTPYAFGREWAKIVRGYLDGYKTVNAALIRYEDLDNGSDVQHLEDYLGWGIPRSSQLRRIRGPESDRSLEKTSKNKLPTADRALLNLAAGEALRHAGYTNT